MSGQLNSGLSLKDKIASVRADPTFHDVIIVCSDGVEIGACRAILALQSPVFKAMLYGNMQEAMSNKINLRNIESATLHTVLQFIHTENINSMDNSVAMDVYHAADYLLLPNLMKLVLKRAHDMRFFEVSTSLLNEATVSLPRDESTEELYNILKPFYTHSLAIGDLNGLTEDALGLLLKRFAKMTTPAYDLLLCVIEWAWSRNATAQPATERHAIFDAVNRMPAEPRPRILLGSGPSRTSLLKMMQQINFTLICPYRLKYLNEVVDVFTEISSQYLVFHNACKDARCSESRPSEFCGISKLRFQWKSSSESVIEYRPELAYMLSSVRASAPCMAGPNGLCEWDIIVESTGLSGDSNINILGFVLDTWWYKPSIVGEWCIYSNSNSSHSQIYRKGITPIKNYSPIIRKGDIVTFHLNLGDRTCAISINGTNYGTAWTDLPRDESFTPAANLYSHAKYQIRPHVRQVA